MQDVNVIEMPARTAIKVCAFFMIGFVCCTNVKKDSFIVAASKIALLTIDFYLNAANSLPVALLLTSVWVTFKYVIKARSLS